MLQKIRHIDHIAGFPTPCICNNLNLLSGQSKKLNTEKRF